jgi:hypothetical protein
MASVSLNEIRDAWRLFLIDMTFGKNYTLAYGQMAACVPRNPIIERLLPSLFHVKAVAILDYALYAWIDGRRLTIPTGYRSDLNGKINFLADNGHLSDRGSLHAIRGTRNEIAHDPGGEVTWGELATDLKVIHAALEELNIVEALQTWEPFVECSGAMQPEISNAVSTFHYRFGIKHGEKMVADIKWASHLMNEGS